MTGGAPSMEHAARGALQNEERPSLAFGAVGALKKGAENFRPALLEIAIPLEPALQQSLNSLLRFRPGKRGQK